MTIQEPLDSGSLLHRIALFSQQIRARSGDSLALDPLYIPALITPMQTPGADGGLNDAALSQHADGLLVLVQVGTQVWTVLPGSLGWIPPGVQHAARWFGEAAGLIDAIEPAAAIVERMRAARGLQPGAVGSGVFPELKHSKDLRISGLDGWQDVDHQLQHAVFNGLLTYLRRYPQALIAPLMLQIQDSNGQPRRLSAEDFPDMPQQQLADLARTCLRPGAINLQWYAAGEGGYPYWHCELYPKDAQAETLHRHVLWTLYLNDEFEEGETEFLFQGRKIAPRTGSLLIAPTAFTHTHRGNRPQGGDKFIATSWILFQSAQKLFGGR